MITPSDTLTQAKSKKRGIAFDLASAADMKVISKGISWWYNWGASPNSKVPSGYHNTYHMDYFPMLWGGLGSLTADDVSAAKSFLLAHTEVQYLLVMNEPNLTNQANRTPAEAAADWLIYEQVVKDLAAQGRTVYLVGPAITWGTMSGYSNPVTWLDAFYAAYRAQNSGKDRSVPCVCRVKL